MNKLMYWEWLPQIMYNHHQTGPAGTVMFSPPFRDPFNYNFDPMIVTGLDMVGAHMHHRFLPGREAGVHDALGFVVFDLVERRAADDGVLPEHHRPADRDHRQPDADADSGDAGLHPAARRHPGADCAAGVALPPVDRLLGDGQLRGVRSCVALQGSVPLQHLQDGIEPDRARLARSLDDLERGHGAAAHDDGRPRPAGGSGRLAADGGRGGARTGSGRTRRPMRRAPARPAAAAAAGAVAASRSRSTTRR